MFGGIGPADALVQEYRVVNIIEIAVRVQVIRGVVGPGQQCGLHKGLIGGIYRAAAVDIGNPCFFEMQFPGRGTGVEYPDVVYPYPALGILLKGRRAGKKAVSIRPGIVGGSVLVPVQSYSGIGRVRAFKIFLNRAYDRACAAVRGHIFDRSGDTVCHHPPCPAIRGISGNILRSRAGMHLKHLFGGKRPLPYGHVGYIPVKSFAVIEP